MLPLPLGRVDAVPVFTTFGSQFDEEYGDAYRVRSWFGTRVRLADAEKFVGVLRSEPGPPTSSDATTLALLARSAMWISTALIGCVTSGK